MRTASSGGRPATAAALSGRLHVVGGGPGFQLTRKDLSGAARNAMRGLKLKPSARFVLHEMVGCWGEKTVNERIMVYPSNEYLVDKTGLSERAVRYGIRRLVDLELITPRDSANGKRFAIRNRQGVVLDVFGFDLTPLFARRSEWVCLMADQDAQKKARARRFDEVTICRRAVEEVLSALARLGADGSAIAGRLEQLVSQTPRRNLTSAESVLVPILESWRQLRGTAEEAFYRTASGGKSCQHIESRPSESTNSNLEQVASNEAVRVEDPATLQPPADVKLVIEACPSLSSFVELPKDDLDLVATGRYLRSSLGANPAVWDEACAALGPINAAATVCLVFQLYNDDADSGKGQRIRNPGGYLRAMVRTFAEGRSNVRYELMALIRKRQAPND